MTREQRMSCEKIIRKASAAAGAASVGGGAPVFGAGMGLMPIQVSMATSLGNVFGVTLRQSSAKGLCTSTAALVLGVSPWVDIASMWSNIRNAVQVTEKIGWKLAADFAGREY